MGYAIKVLALGILIWGWAPSGFASTSDLAASSVSSTGSPSTSRSFTQFSDPVGVGTLYQKAGGKTDYAVVVEDDNHFSQRGKFLGVTRYGFAESRLELGTSTGVNLAAVSGITVFGLKEGQWFSPHIGVEPFNARLTWNTSDERESFYEWFPMVSVGPQLAAGTCRILPLVRGGAAIGNLGNNGLRPRFARAFGTGAHLNCAGFNLGAELTRTDGSPSPIDLGTIDVSYHPSFTDMKFGFRAESIIHRSDRSSLFSNAPSSLRQERRVLFIVRATPL